MAWFADGSGKRGRSLTYSDSAIQFRLSLKCLFGLPLRQSIGLVESLLELSGLDWPVPDFSTVSRRQKRLQVVSRRCCCAAAGCAAPIAVIAHEVEDALDVGFGGLGLQADFEAEVARLRVHVGLAPHNLIRHHRARWR